MIRQIVKSYDPQGNIRHYIEYLEDEYLFDTTFEHRVTTYRDGSKLEVKNYFDD